jgi:ribokinase
MTKVVCLGDVMVDVLARLPGPLAVGSDTPAPIALLGGGSAANTAVWLASTGTTTTLVGRVGSDELGRIAISDLRAAGVTPLVAIDPERPTGTCIVLVDVDGERTMIPAAGANSGLGEQSLPADLLGVSDHLHLSGYALFNDGARPAALAALELARRVGAGISVDAASAAPLRTIGAARFLDWVGSAVLLIANQDEAQVLTGCADAAECARTLAGHTGEAIVKQGRDGAIWSDGHRTIMVPAEPVELIDTTGAGDAFAAGALAARITGGDVDTALRAGVRLAATAVSRLGGRPPTGSRPTT